MNISVGRRVNGSGRAGDDFSPPAGVIPPADAAKPPKRSRHLDPDPGFSMRVSVQKRAIEVRIAGELDVYAAFLFTMALKRLERLEPQIITVDLTDLEFIDSSGLAALREAGQRAHQAGRSFKAKRPSPSVRRFLTLAGEGAILELPLPYLTPAPCEPDQTGVAQA